MGTEKPAILVTGIAGNLGSRLLPLLADFEVIGVDLNPPETSQNLRFERFDLGVEESCRQLFLLIKETRPFAVIHLAFIIDPLRSGVLDEDRMWQINVAGTARVMEAITEANRDEPIVRKFIFPSSVSVYGSDLTSDVTEDAPFAAHTLPYAVHKMEADKVVQQRAPALRGCSAYMLRPHIYAGASVENYLLGAFRGSPNGKSKRAANMRAKGQRLPCMLPYGKRYLENRMQFVHVDDMARLLAYIVHKNEPESKRLTVLNVAGRGEALTIGRCVELAKAPLKRVPGKSAFGLVLKFLWKRGISAIPPDALPYIIGQYTMNSERLKQFLGDDYEQVIRYTNEDAYSDSFSNMTPSAQSAAAR